MNAGTRINHRRSGLAGTVEATAERLHQWDNQGPWAQVQFDDGLACRVPFSELLVRGDDGLYRSAAGEELGADELDELGLDSTGRGL